MELDSAYQRDSFIEFLQNNLLPDFKKDIRSVNLSGLSSIKNANYLGESKYIDIQVFEFLFEGSAKKRVALTKDAFSVMRSSAIYKALAVFHSPDNKDWRFSLMTATPEATEKGKVSVSYSNPKRLSFFLGPNAKVNTPTKFLVSKGKVSDFEDLKNRFSIEVVNKEFYKEISQAFTKLVNGLLKLPSTEDKSQTNLEFAVRLIGRVIFCWFLREKKSNAGRSLMPNELLSLGAIAKYEDYYHNILEPIFFEILNRPIRERLEKFAVEPFSSIPYLNGGLFSPEKDDFYKRGVYQSDFYNVLNVPDVWIKEFFEILETYNFTIDENTAYDEELSIDPEMLGRIFENLLAEINPETGESARKSTGSYYTPRIIVDYMVDESIILYLKQSTEINEEKLRAVISYELDDDVDNPLKDEEKEMIVNALEKVKILDPACGSGAFPIGSLQKIVFILQQVDPDGKLWFKKQLEKATPEFRKDIEKKFSNKEFDFLRKLGVIRECIYGVDIQPIATEISRLRCFLTLIVDEYINDDEENRGVRPLPNLDFKFVTANSLIGLPKIDTTNIQQPLLQDNKEDIDQLKNVRDQYFASFGIERAQLKTDFSDQQKLLMKQMFRDYNHAGELRNNLMQKLTDWEPFTHKKTEWFDIEWMFGIKDGFDIVIANPPYVSVKEISRENKKTFNKTLETGKGRFNLFTLFLEKGSNFLKNGGVQTFILPEGLYSNVEYKYIRKYILDNLSIAFINLFSNRVFEAAVDTSIIGTLKTVNKFDNFPIIRDLKATSVILSQKNFKNLPYYLFAVNLDLQSSPIINKVLAAGIESIENILEIQQGIIYSGQTKEKVFSNEIIDSRYKKILDGRDILKWKLNWENKLENKYICYTDKLHRPREERLFLANEKIVLPRRSTKISCALDDKQYYLLNTAYICLLKDQQYSLKFIMGVLNSRLINYFYNKLFFGWQVTIPALESIRVPIKKELQDKIEHQVGKILAVTKSETYLEDLSFQEKVKEYEMEIDQLVYKLYDLTIEEIEIVENH